MSSYNNNQQIFALTYANDNTLVTGLIYSFVYRAHNQIGYSDFSSMTSVGLNALPPAPSNLVYNQALSNMYTIAISWDMLTVSDGPSGNIIGYIVQMDNGRGGSFVEVFNG